MDDAFILLKDLNEYVLFDTETTGMSNGDLLIQLSALKIRGGAVIDTFNEHINPNVSIPSKIVKLTGISDETVKNADTADNVINRFFDFCGDHLLAGHNVQSYDIPRTELKAYDFKYGVIDTRYIAERCGIKPCSNEALAQLYNIDYSKAHNALEDCRITFSWFSRLIECYPDKEAKVKYYIGDDEPVPELPLETMLAIAENRRRTQICYTERLKRIVGRVISLFDAHGYGRQYLECVYNRDDSISIWIKEPVTDKRSMLCKIAANADGYCYNVSVKGNTIESKADIEYCSMQKRTSKAGKVTQEIQIPFSECHTIRILYKILYACISNYRPSERFACCHLYMQCSDMKQCVSEDKIYSNACWYKRNLMQGKIFYGKNKNAGE